MTVAVDLPLDDYSGRPAALRQLLLTETGGEYPRFVASLDARYNRVWRDIGLAYGALLVVAWLMQLPEAAALRVAAILPGAVAIGAALDIGGGTGWMLNEARRVEPRLKTTVIVDIDAQAQGLATANHHQFVASRIENFTTDQRFDLVLMLNLIEHVADPVAVLAAVGRLLTPQGRILLKTPNHASLDAQLFRQSYWGGLHCPRHWVIFTPASLESAARRAGLAVQTLEETQGAPFWCWSVLAGLARRGWILVSAQRPMVQHPLAPVLIALFAAFDFVRRPLMGRSGRGLSQLFVVLGARK